MDKQQLEKQIQHYNLAGKLQTLAKQHEQRRPFRHLPKQFSKGILIGNIAIVPKKASETRFVYVIADMIEAIVLYDNIEGEDLYKTIINSSKVIAFHGMMTNLASISKKKVIDMWFCDIKNFNDYKNYRNAFYEFKPKYDGYNFIIPSKQIDKTIKKLSNFI